MVMNEPAWAEYIIWDYSDPENPKPVGLRKDTPKELQKLCKKDVEEMTEYIQKHPFEDVF